MDSRSFKTKANVNTFSSSFVEIKMQTYLLTLLLHMLGWLSMEISGKDYWFQFLCISAVCYRILIFLCSLFTTFHITFFNNFLASSPQYFKTLYSFTSSMDCVIFESLFRSKYWTFSIFCIKMNKLQIIRM